MKKKSEVTDADIARMNVEAACRHQTGDLRVGPKLLADFQRMVEFAPVMGPDRTKLLEARFLEPLDGLELAGKYKHRLVYLDPDDDFDEASSDEF